MRNNCGINSSNVANYQAILEEHFIAFLIDQGTSEKTRNNYCSDLRHFVGWTILTTAATNQPIPQNHLDFVRSITSDTLRNYKLYLVENDIPPATINRRLSTIRMFFRCALTHGWANKNVAATITNVLPAALPNEDYFNTILSRWEQDLEREGASKSTIKNYLMDVRKFLEWHHIYGA